MANTKLQEKFSEGVVTNRPRIGLQPGELEVATECFYRPNDDGLHLLPAVSNITSPDIAVTATGIAYTERDSVSIPTLAELLFVSTASTMYFAAADDSLIFVAFAAWPSGGTLTGLEIVQHAQALYFITGDTKIVKVADDPGVTADLVPAGYDPTPDRDDITVGSFSPGTWNPDSGPGIWWYWMTEYNPVHDVESGFTPPAQPFTTSNNLTESADITLVGALNNPTATHWRVYRSAQNTHPTASPIDNWDQFPVGFLISELPIGTTNFRDDGDPIFDTPYPLVVVDTDAVPGLSDQQNGPPPNSSITGDMFENSLCVNDGLETGIMKYSYPDQPYSWPAAYFISFETKTRDIITKIRALNNLLIVGMKETLWRVNLLPRATDAAFDRGRIADVISFNHGILNHKAADLYTTEDGVTKLAFVSRQGLFSTDGHTVTPLVRDIEFNGLIDNEAEVVLRNYPTLEVLVMFYDDGAGNNNQALFIHYHSSHRKQHGGFKVTGPHAITAFDATYSHSDLQSLPSLYMLEDLAGAGGVKVRRFGSTDSATDMTARTRTVYPGDFNSEVHILRTYLLHGAGTGSGTLNLLGENFDAVPTALDTGAFTPDTVSFTELEHARTAAGFQIQVDSPAPIYFVGVEIDPTRRD